MQSIQLLRGPQIWNCPALTARPATQRVKRDGSTVKRAARRARPASNGRAGFSRATFLAMVAAGLMPKPVKLSPRVNGWPAAEIDAVLAARIAGSPDSEIRELVSQLIAQRQAPVAT